MVATDFGKVGAMADREKFAEVVFDMADDAYVDLEAHLAAAMSRD